MKWFFALNQTSWEGRPDYWRSLILTAVGSARRHTSLDPHFIFDGEPNEFTRLLEALGVKILRHKVSFYDVLEQYGQARPGWLSIASGAFLRTELPLVEHEDQVVVYTDCDVLFAREPEFSGIPRLFSCAPEFKQEDYVHFNTGVMLMNLPALRESLPTFVEFIRANLDDCKTFDQDAYRIHYGLQADRLSTALNWKPYWGYSGSASIIHFHGPKPEHARQFLTDLASPADPNLHHIFSWNPEGYKVYMQMWETEAAAAHAELPPH